MNIRHLKIFYEVLKNENITLSAKQLYISQPAVSAAIKDLEKETGLVLFDRIGKKIKITEAGKEFLKKVTPLLSAYDDLKKVQLQLRKKYHFVLDLVSQLLARNYQPLSKHSNKKVRLPFI
ncbi:DNA-binding transcriptional LysR family regulator [Breznakia sp. PF5-3]|uniref:LysR family transcriptional regulator n=1 Tax=unclassified Breznakia TaxID=2623764 RepID=UPI0024066850|nr:MULTISPECIES: LysR family transcriptional regulator [unclassified Breznakia]MDF9823843.1 DNA-binding transcriptional LysR family regulator [Breznakia sp. PM6-1]MDF9834591.1 DNA-binding transcriptional LysR family regulator [Breznakia sp. PF5-3]MDF9836792.1 DNA-binding transcriptional LysR family regulator [Breznakia sp. PFB2-8]MDF9858759.1 DNA-binding transcriptional LysR family regulator [Breznakia sp. PH5-24]